MLNSAWKRCANTQTHSGAKTHTWKGARRHTAWACASRRELVSIANSSAGWYERPPAGAACRCRVVSALFSRAAARRRSPAPSARCPPSAWRCRSPPARSGAAASRVMRRASSRGTSISPRELRREPGSGRQQRPRRSRGQPSQEREYTRNEGHGHRRGSGTHTVEPLEDPVPRELPEESPEREEPAEPPREPGESTGVRRPLMAAPDYVAPIVGWRSWFVVEAEGRLSALLDRLSHALAAAAGASRELPQQRVQG
jgi:hypothetical protein